MSSLPFNGVCNVSSRSHYQHFASSKFSRALRLPLSNLARHLQAESLEPFPDLTQPELAFIPYPAAAHDRSLTVQLHDLYLRILDMEDLMEMARHAVVSKAEEVARSGSSGRGPIVLDLPCTFFMLRSLRCVIIGLFF